MSLRVALPNGVVMAASADVWLMALVQGMTPAEQERVCRAVQRILTAPGLYTPNGGGRVISHPAGGGGG